MIFTALTCVCADVFNEKHAQLPPTAAAADSKDGCAFYVPGGEALNFTCALRTAAPDISAHIIGAVGNDEAGNAIRGAAEQRGVNTECLHTVSGRTASNITYLTDDGDRYYKDDSWDGGVYQTYQLGENDRALLLRSDLVLTSIYCPSLREIISLKTKSGFLLSLDLNDCRNFSDWEEFLGTVDLFFISGDKAVCEWALERSGNYGGVFVVTLGAAGSRAYHNGKEYAAEAVKVDNVVDTTGCGDSFQAGFAAEYIRSENIAAALQKGAEAAARVIGIYGGII